MTRTIGACKDCGRTMVSKRQYSKSAEIRARFAKHDGHQLCRACYGRAAVHGTLPNPAPRGLPRQPPRRRADVLDDYAILRGRGYDRRQCAGQLGMTLSGLDRALQRARAAGELVPA